MERGIERRQTQCENNCAVLPRRGRGGCRVERDADGNDGGVVSNSQLKKIGCSVESVGGEEEGGDVS